MKSHFKLVSALIVSCSLLLAACGEDEPELTIEERLANVEGRTLTDTEVADKLATAGILCQLDGQVLDAIWRQLNERQLNYQDVVFSQICPDRSVFYAGLTGRYVTDEATESGVVTSTTRPRQTTTTVTTAPTTPTTAPRATIVPAPSDPESTVPESTGPESTGPDSEDPSDSPITIVPPSTTEVGEGG